MANDETLLTTFQIEVAHLFFALPASDGFLLAGGAALLAQHLTARPTHDLDFFTRPGGGNVAQARDELVAAVGRRGWSVDTCKTTTPSADCSCTDPKISSSISPWIPRRDVPLR